MRENKNRTRLKDKEIIAIWLKKVNLFKKAFKSVKAE